MTIDWHDSVDDDVVTLGKLATHDMLKTTHLTKTAPILTFLQRRLDANLTT